MTSVEAARSRMEFLGDLRAAGYERGIGPGVWDIHSPRVPTVAEMTDALSRALTVVEADRLWVNPDCGLRHLAPEVARRKLRAMVSGAAIVRTELGLPDPVTTN